MRNIDEALAIDGWSFHEDGEEVYKLKFSIDVRWTVDPNDEWLPIEIDPYHRGQPWHLNGNGLREEKKSGDGADGNAKA